MVESLIAISLWFFGAVANGGGSRAVVSADVARGRLAAPPVATGEVDGGRVWLVTTVF